MVLASPPAGKSSFSRFSPSSCSSWRAMRIDSAARRFSQFCLASIAFTTARLDDCSWSLFLGPCFAGGRLRHQAADCHRPGWRPRWAWLVCRPDRRLCWSVTCIVAVGSSSRKPRRLKDRIEPRGSTRVVYDAPTPAARSLQSAARSVGVSVTWATPSTCLVDRCPTPWAGRTRAGSRSKSTIGHWCLVCTMSRATTRSMSRATTSSWPR